LLITPISHYWYKFIDELYPKKDEPEFVFDDTKKVAWDHIITKLVADQLIYSPWCTIFYILFMKTVDNKVQLNFQDLQKQQWRIWVLAQLANFLIMPKKYRILYMNVFGFVWNILIQFFTAAKKSRLPISL